MTKHRSRSNPRASALAVIAAVALASGPEAAADSAPPELSLGIGGLYSAQAGAAIESRASAAYEAYGPVLAARVAGDGSASMGASGATPSFTSAAGVDFSAAFEPFVALLSLEGGVARGATYVEGGGDLRSAKASLELALNGVSVSGSLTPRALWRSGPDGRTELGAALGLSLSAGDFVVKPGADAAWMRWADGSESLELRPGLGFSWYPGFPLSLSGGAGFRRTWTDSGASLDEIPVNLSLFGAAGGRATFKLGAEGLWPLAGSSFSSASASAELSIRLGGTAGGDLRLPVGVSWYEDANGWDLGVRAGLEFAL